MFVRKLVFDELVIYEVLFLKENKFILGIGWYYERIVFIYF